MEKYEVIDPDETQDYSCPTLHVTKWSRKCLDDGDLLHEVILVHEDTDTPTRVLLSERVVADFRDCIKMTDTVPPDGVSEVMVKPLTVDRNYGAHS